MKREISRQEFEQSALLERDLADDPFKQFSNWWDDAIRANVREDIPVIDVDANINDGPFSVAAVESLLNLIRLRAGTSI